MMDEARTLRERQAELGRATDDADIPPQGACPLVVKTKTVGTYPTSAKSYYVVTTQTPGGTEVEGGTLSLSAVTGDFFAGNIGNAIPPSGTEVIAHPIGGRWIFAYYG